MRPAFRFCSIALALAVVNPEARSQIAQTMRADPDFTLERSYVGGVIGGRDHVVELHASNHLRITPRRNADDFEHWAATRIGETRRRRLLTMSWNMTIRGHNTFEDEDVTSTPIRTPSIGFGGRLQWVTLHRDTTKATFFLHQIGLIHHSNGQDGCPFKEQARPTDASDCVPSDGEVVNGGTLNIRDGSFGTNYFAYRFAASRRNVKPDGTLGGGWATWIEPRIHTEFPFGGLDRDFANRYGKYELALTWQREFSVPRVWKFDAVQVAQYAWGRVGMKEHDAHWGGHIEATWLGFSGGQAGVFARLNVGNDYYNIRFEDKARFLMIGVAWDHGRLTSLLKPDTTASQRD